MGDVLDAAVFAVFVPGSAIHGQAWVESAKDHFSDTHRFPSVWMFRVEMPATLRGPWKPLA
jgi:menaquinone-dependent protoporphyrinogen oxidase